MLDRRENLSPEVLATCFRFLGFRDLIAVSHVSRFWRASALAFPDLWAHISLGETLRNSSKLVHMAISRAGQLPVDFEHLAPEIFAESMAHAISQHLHRFRGFKCVYLEGVDTCHAAPFLRKFVCGRSVFHVPPGFLGGSTSTCSLRTLLLAETIFPPQCHALASVTHLRATLPQSYHGDSDFRYIFELCPRLEILELNKLEGSAGVYLPAGPAPRTLREVTLRTCTVCNLVELFSTWALETVPDVRLEMPIDADLDLDLAPFFADATSLSVTFEGEDSDETAARMVAEPPNARRRRRSFLCTGLTNVLDPSAALAVLAAMLQAREVGTLEIPLGLLTGVTGRWPRLAHLSADICDMDIFSPSLDDDIRDSPPGFDWMALECLRDLPPLQTLELHVRAASVSNPLALDDAKELKACLSALRDCIPREVHVHGFSADVARYMPVLDGDEPRVVLCYGETAM